MNMLEIENLIFENLLKLVRSYDEQDIETLKNAYSFQAEHMRSNGDCDSADYWENAVNELDDAWRAEKVRRTRL